MTMKEYDVIIIGGGIHGAGVLQAAAAAGHKALLIERQGLASGTSSRSSKLIHGGLRYLESGQFALVRESLRERAIHLRIASELVELKPFFIPVYRDTRRRPWQLKIGLWMYALLGGFDAATRFGSVPKSEWPSLDGLKTSDLDAVIRYHDAQTNDALLTRAVVKSALSLGAELAMPARFTRAVLSETGVTVSFTCGSASSAGSAGSAGSAAVSVEVKARVLVNAAGPWATQVARSVEPAISVPDVDLVQGTHIVIPHPLAAGIYYVESPTDGRAVFVMPWGGATLIGTTETPYHGDPDKVQPLPEEEEYLLAVVRHYFPALSALTRDDITERFAGLRVLPAATQAAFDRSRETIFTTDRDARPRVLGIYGGKLTGWRAAAAHVMQRISPSLPAAVKRADTDLLILRRPTT
jgi:glycerol-3-phosphate dehydrogenase